MHFTGGVTCKARFEPPNNILATTPLFPKRDFSQIKTTIKSELTESLKKYSRFLKFDWEFGYTTLLQLKTSLHLTITKRKYYSIKARNIIKPQPSALAPDRGKRVQSN